jgi:hypothetical protein
MTTPKQMAAGFEYGHDCYHTGQTEIMRRASGKGDTVI